MSARRERACASCGAATLRVIRGLCDSCFGKARYYGTLADWPRVTRSRDELLEDYQLLRSDGLSREVIAARLGMHYDSLMRALVRAARAGDTRSDWTPHPLYRTRQEA